VYKFLPKRSRKIKDHLELRFSIQITPQPVFWIKKFPRPTTEDFYHLHFADLSQGLFYPTFNKKLYNSHAHDPFEILHDPLPGRDPSVEKHWSRAEVSNQGATVHLSAVSWWQGCSQLSQFHDLCAYNTS